MNRFTATGRLTQDPELKSLSSGDSVCQLRLAVEGMAPGRETGYVDVATFGNPGQAAARVLSKGWLVAVDGRLEYRTWETDEGHTRRGYRVVGSVEFLAAPRATSGEASGSDPEPAEKAA
jgi:single-strand DNA-binding protein